MRNYDKAKQLWEDFGAIPINENEEIEQKFLHFEVGTPREEVWHWFEDEFDLSVAEDLMFRK